MNKNYFAILSFALIFFVSSCQTRKYTPDIDGTTVQIMSLQPFAGADNVRIECSLQLFSDLPESKVSAEIFDAKNGRLLWEGVLESPEIKKGENLTVTKHVTSLKPKLWCPVSPNLYYLRIHAGDAVKTVRFGFRDFTMKGGQFYLNGNRIFLRGNAINPPDRGIPKDLEESRQFAQDYIRFLKSININIIRIPENQTWADVCDEEGMMLFGGRYGRPSTESSNDPPTDYERPIQAYKEKDLAPFVRHPSMMIYTLTNEMPYIGERGDQYARFLSHVYSALREWDPNRLYICNAGYGLGRSADVYDVHRYWAWYYNSFLTYMNLRDMSVWQNEGREQPITFTECVGNYTGVDGRFNLVSNSKQPASQKCWTGHTPDCLQSERALGYQSFVVKNATEFFRRFRSQNPRLAGIMPFTIMFFNWSEIQSFEQMGAKPVTEQFRISYQPVLPSIELWKTQVYSGAELDFTIHIVNDDDHCRAFKNGEIRHTLETLDGKPVVASVIPVPEIPYYQTEKFPVRIQIPDNLPTDDYKITVRLLSKGKETSFNEAPLLIAEKMEYRPAVKTGRKIYLYDPAGKTKAVLALSNIPFAEAGNIGSLEPESSLVIGEDAWDETLSKQSAQLQQFVRNGGRILCLKQHHETFDTQWLPAKIEMNRFTANDFMYPVGNTGNMNYLSPTMAYRDGMNINPERPDHPVFSGMDRKRLELWSDYTGYNESMPGFPQIYPVTQGFDIKSTDMKDVAVLANYSRALAGIALCEMFSGKGSVLLTGFDLTGRCDIDPVAGKLFDNLIAYNASNEAHECYILIDQPIVWGDFASERGLVTGYNNGLLLHTVPIVPESLKDRLPLRTDALGYQNAGGAGGWNDRPGVQYIAQGRRPFAPFSYSPGGNPSIASREHLASGEGHFYLRIPTGKTVMMTEVENPVNEPMELSIQINDGKVQKTILPGSTTIVVSTPLSGSPETLKVKYSGDRKIILRKTWYE